MGAGSVPQERNPTIETVMSTVSSSRRIAQRLSPDPSVLMVKVRHSPPLVGAGRRDTLVACPDHDEDDRSSTPTSRVSYIATLHDKRDSIKEWFLSPRDF